jgi:hypothetical protein
MSKISESVTWQTKSSTRVSMGAKNTTPNPSTAYRELLIPAAQTAASARPKASLKAQADPSASIYLPNCSYRSDPKALLSMWKSGFVLALRP